MTIVQKLNNLQYFTYLISIVTIDARCTNEMKSGLPWQNQHVTRWRLFSPENLT